MQTTDTDLNKWETSNANGILRKDLILDKSDYVVNYEIKKIWFLSNTFSFPGEDSHMLLVNAEIQISTNLGKKYNKNFEIVNFDDERFKNDFKNHRRRNENREDFFTFKTLHLKTLHKHFIDETKINFNFMTTDLFFKKKRKLESNIADLNRRIKNLQQELTKKEFQLIRMQKESGNSIHLDKGSVENLNQSKKIHFVVNFGVNVLKDVQEKLYNHERKFRKGVYRQSNVVPVVFKSGCSKIMIDACCSDITGIVVDHVKEIEAMNKITSSLKTDNTETVVNELARVTQETCPSMWTLVGGLIHSSTSEEKVFKQTGIINSIVSSSSKSKNYFARIFHKWILPMGVTDPIVKLLNNLFGITYSKKLDPVFVKEVAEDRSKARVVKKDETLFVFQDNASKSAEFGTFRNLHHFTAQVFWKKKIPKFVQKAKRLYTKKTISYSELEFSFPNFSEINKLCEEGLEYCLKEKERNENRRKGITKKVKPPTIFVEELIHMEDGFTHEAMLNCVESTFSEYKFEERVGLNLRFAGGDFQYYCQLCKKYGMDEHPLAGHLHFRMAVTDLAYQLEKFHCLLSINVILNYKCPFAFQNSKFQRTHKLVKHSYLAVCSISKKVERFPNTFDEIMNCNNFHISCFAIYKIVGSILFKLEKLIRANKFGEVSKLWDLIQPLLYWFKKNNIGLENISQRIRRKCLHSLIRKWLDSDRATALKHSDACVDGDTINEFCIGQVKKTPMKESDIQSFCVNSACIGTIGMNEGRGVQSWIRRRRYYGDYGVRKSVSQNIVERSAAAVEQVLLEYLLVDCDFKNVVDKEVGVSPLIDDSLKLTRSRRNPKKMFSFWKNPDEDFIESIKTIIAYFNTKKTVFKPTKKSTKKKKKKQVAEEEQEQIPVPISEMFDYGEYEKSVEYVPDANDEDEEFDESFESNELLK